MPGPAVGIDHLKEYFAMSANVQYAALARLLTHNNRVHDMEDMLRRMWVPSDWTVDDADVGGSWIPNPFSELQNDMDRESRACLVSCWAALPITGEGGDLIA
jgi:protein involved in temperature-dependent protein secretion